MENAFGILAARFRIFGRPIDCQPEKAVKIVKACVALHNFLASTEQARYMPASFVDTTADTGEVQPGERRQHVEGDRNMVDGPRCSVGRARPSQRVALVRANYRAGRLFSVRCWRVSPPVQCATIGYAH